MFCKLKSYFLQHYESIVIDLQKFVTFFYPNIISKFTLLCYFNYSSIVFIINIVFITSFYQVLNVQHKTKRLEFDCLYVRISTYSESRNKILVEALQEHKLFGVCLEDFSDNMWIRSNAPSSFLETSPENWFLFGNCRKKLWCAFAILTALR